MIKKGRVSADSAVGRIERNSEHSNEAGNVVWWVVSVLIVAVAVIIFLASQLQSWVRENIGSSMSLGSAVLVVLFVIGVVLFQISKFSDGSSSSSSSSGGYRTRTRRYKRPRCGYIGKRSELPCIRPFGHSGHHRYR